MVYIHMYLYLLDLPVLIPQSLERDLDKLHRRSQNISGNDQPKSCTAMHSLHLNLKYPILSLALNIRNSNVLGNRFIPNSHVPYFTRYQRLPIFHLLFHSSFLLLSSCLLYIILSKESIE